MGDSTVVESNLQNSLERVARGKVRDLYAVDDKTLLFVATDRISVYDVILSSGIPQKGALLNLLSAHWFSILSAAIPNLKTHFVSLEVPQAVPAALHANLRNRSMQVRRLQIFPIEAIVRGYITGSAWKEYQAKGTVHGMNVAQGLQESQEFPDGPIFTPSTKAEAGKNDENIHPDKAIELIGEKYARRIETLSLKLYTTARDYARQRGIIIADTKFEFGLDVETDEVVLVDEVLTPDSSRFWPASTYKVGVAQDSFDKQYVRDWVATNGYKGKEGVTLPDDVVRQTGDKYREAFELLVGKPCREVIG
ncbi:MAG: hypothetical protein M1825_005317 [Sarcosagium campestre]|nr:MAG: hypothetical protein M1825_005317 [Sarcosagium campestre]